jgi:hypothetical protein
MKNSNQINRATVIFQAKQVLISRSLFSRVWHKRIFGSTSFRYIETAPYVPKDHISAKELIKKIELSRLHPAVLNISDITPYEGAVFSVLKAVDQTDMDKNFPKQTPRIPAAYMRVPLLGDQLFKIGASLTAMTLPTLGMPDQMKNTLAYLSLNAARNIIADLGAKHRVTSWRKHLDHIKVGKLTDSLLVTSLTFPVLYFLKQHLHTSLADTPSEWYLTFLAISLSDALIQYGTRIYRNFSGDVAERDFFRPFIADAGALSLFYLGGIGLEQSFAYLLARKVFAELWTGYVEISDKRREKVEERKQNLKDIFDLDAYKVPDPEAMAAINLAYLLHVKSVSRKVFLDMLQGKFTSENFTEARFIEINKAMNNMGRIRRMSKFLFEGGGWQKYHKAMLNEFRDNRDYYFSWIKENAPDHPGQKAPQ